MNTNKLSLVFCFVMFLISCSEKDSSVTIELGGSHWECKDTVRYIGSPKVIYCAYDISFEGTTFRYEAEETIRLLGEVNDTTYIFTGDYTYHHPTISLNSTTFSATGIVTEKDMIFEPDSCNRTLRFTRIK